MKYTDYTGIAYLVGMGLLVAGGYLVYRKAADLGGPAADAVAAAAKAATDGAKQVVTAITSIPNNLANTVADAFPSGAEQRANLVMSPDYDELKYQVDQLGPLPDLPPLIGDPFSPPNFVGNIPDDPTKPAIFFRSPTRTRS